MLYRHVCIEAAGYELPETTLSSSAIEERLSKLWEALHLPPGYLANLTGIQERRVWPVGTTPSSVAAKAAQKALEQAQCAPETVDLVIHTGVCRDALEPSTANVVHKLLDLPPHCQAFDLSNACLGFLNGLCVAANMIELGQINTALVVSGENSGPIYEDTIRELLADPSAEALRRNLASLTLGSAAVAFVLQKESLSRSRHFLVGAYTQTDHDSVNLCQGSGDLYHQRMVTDTAQLMKKGLILSQITWELFKRHLHWDEKTPAHVFNHQVSRSHQEKVFALLGLDSALGYNDLEQLGNTGSVATPLSLALRAESGLLHSGDKIAMLGIGSGLNCLMLGVTW